MMLSYQETTAKPVLDGLAAAVLFCARCGSNSIDQNSYIAETDEIEVRCYACGHAARLIGFRVGRAYVEAAIREAAKDVA